MPLVTPGLVPFEMREPPEQSLASFVRLAPVAKEINKEAGIRFTARPVIPAGSRGRLCRPDLQRNRVPDQRREPDCSAVASRRPATPGTRSTAARPTATSAIEPTATPAATPTEPPVAAWAARRARMDPAGRATCGAARAAAAPRPRRCSCPPRIADGLRVPVLQRSDLRHRRLSRDLREPDPVRGRHRELHVHRLQPRRHRDLHAARPTPTSRRPTPTPTTGSATRSRSPATATPLSSERHARTATRPGSTATRPTTLQSTAARCTCSSAQAATWSQQAYIKASNTGGRRRVRHAASRCRRTATRWRSGPAARTATRPGSTATRPTTPTTDAGAVYVFTRSGTTWTQQAYVKASNTRARTTSSATASRSSTDGNTLAVGADCEDSNATGINGNQTDYTAVEQRRGLRVHPLRHDLEPAGVCQGVQHGDADDRFGHERRAVERRQHAGGRRRRRGQQRDRDQRQPGRQLRHRQRRGLRVHPLGHDLEPAGLHQGVQHRSWRRLRWRATAIASVAVGRRQHARRRSA